MPPSDPPRPPLTDEERRLLTDPAYFAEVAARGPVVLIDRTVENLVIRDQRFTSVEWRGVDFIATRLTATSFTGAQLAQVTFTNCNLAHVAFERCRLVDCAFEFGELEGVRMADTSTQKLSLSACMCSDSVIERTEFDSAKDTASSFAQLALRDVRWNGCEWRGTRFDRPEVEGLTITGGTLAGITFTDARGRGLLVQGTLIDGLDLVLGTWVALILAEEWMRMRLSRVEYVDAEYLDEKHPHIATKCAMTTFEVAVNDRALFYPWLTLGSRSGRFMSFGFENAGEFGDIYDVGTRWNLEVDATPGWWNSFRDLQSFEIVAHRHFGWKPGELRDELCNPESPNFAWRKRFAPYQ